MNPFDIAPILKRILASTAGIEEILFVPDHPPKIAVGLDVLNAPIKDLKRLSAYQTEIIAASLLAQSPRAKRQFLREGAASLSLSIPKTGHFRVQVLRQLEGYSLSLRVVPFHPPTMESLGLPKSLQSLLGERRGLILVTSPDRGGKTTTLAALINHLNQSGPRHIMTVEGPVEYRLPQGLGLVQQVEVDNNPQGYLEGLCKCQRHGAQILVCGYLDSPELLETALEAADSGHLVLGGMRTLGATATLERARSFLHEASARTRFANLLRAIVSQDLLPRRDGGRIATYEILLANEALAKLIERGGPFDLKEIFRQTASLGAQSFQTDTARLARAGMIREEDSQIKLQAPTTEVLTTTPGSRNRVFELDDSIALEVVE